MQLELQALEFQPLVELLQLALRRPQELLALE
jgi:hypothetical protein